MRQADGNKDSKKGKHLNWEERIQIETLQRRGLVSEEIGTLLDRPARTIRREIRRGWVMQCVNTVYVLHNPPVEK